MGKYQMFQTTNQGSVGFMLGQKATTKYDWWEEYTCGQWDSLGDALNSRGEFTGLW